MRTVILIFNALFQPPFSSTRFFGMLLVGYLWSCVASFAIPEEDFGGFNWQRLQILVPLACALGILYYYKLIYF